MDNQSRHILLVEDNPDHIDLAQRALARAGKPYLLSVEQTLDGARAWLQTQTPDLVIADLRLPDGDGLSLLAGMTPPGADLLENTHKPFLVLTGRSGEQHAVEAIQAGALDYVIKSADVFRDFAHIVERALTRWDEVQQIQRSAATLRHHEQLLKQILLTAPDGYWLVDVNGKVLDINETYARMTGYSRAELLSMSIVDIESVETPADTRAHLERVAREGFDQFETRHRRKDGQIIDVEVTARFLDLDGGLYVVFVRDITRRKRYEVALHEREDKLNSIFRAAPAGIGMVVRREITEANERLCEITGYSRQELLGKNSRFLYPSDEDYEFVGREKYRQISERGTGTVETRFLRKDGEVIDVLLSSTPLNQANLDAGVTFTAIDITERKRVEQALRASEHRLATVLQEMPVSVVITENANDVIQYVNDAFVSTTGFSKADVIGRTSREIGLLDPAEFDSMMQKIIESGGIRNIETRYRSKSGELIIGLLSGAVIEIGGKPHLLKVVQDITQRKYAEQALQASEQRFRSLVASFPNAILVVQAGKYSYVNPAACSLTGFTETELVGMDALAVVHPDSRQLVQARMQTLSPTSPNPPVEMKILRKDGRVIYSESTSVHVIFNGKPGALVISQDITERKRAQDELNRNRQKLEEAEKLARLGNYEIDLQTGQAHWSAEVFSIFGLPASTGAPTVETYAALLHPDDRTAVYDLYNQCVAHGGQFDLLYRIIRPDGELRHVHSQARLVPDADGVSRTMFGTLQDITEQVKIQQALRESQNQIQRRLEQLMVIHEIGVAITSNSDVNQIIYTILTDIRKLPGLDAAVLLMPEERTGRLQLKAHIGLMDGVTIDHIMEWGRVQIEAAIAQQRVIASSSLNGAALPCLADPVEPGKFQACAVLPLMVRAQFHGVLLVFSQRSDVFDSDWQEFLHSLAMQAAIAIQNAQLFSEMQMKNVELVVAYEATLQGWSRTLEMRDKETKGHSDRVTHLSVMLARELGMPEAEIQDFRRGVLLHDIGKLAVPDSILLKPGPLTDEEWVIMRQHPLYAYQSLKDIPGLERAIEIPYSHHEKWDGSGYPRGLAGEQIPLGARIFAIVDVWDALTSERPYRPAWTLDVTRTYLINQSGSHFDPRIADAFVRLLDAGKIRKPGSQMEYV